MQLITRQECISLISLEHSFNQKLRIGFFVKLDSRCEDYFPEYSNYFGRSLRLLKSMNGTTYSGKVFADDSTECLLESGFNPSQWQMSIYYKYAQDGTTVFLILMTLYIGIQMKFLENGLLTL